MITTTHPEGYKAHIIIGGYFLMLPIFLALAYNNEHVSDVLRVRAIFLILPRLIFVATLSC